MKKFWQLILILSVTGCTTPNRHAESPPQQTDSIPEEVTFLKDGKLVALLSNELTSYYVVKGQPRGFEYEMLRAFCKDEGLELEIKVIPDFNHIIDSLVAGSGDLAAGNLTITGERMSVVNFSPPLLESRQVLIQRLPEGHKRMSRSQIDARVITNPLDLEGKKVYVHKNSSFYTRIRNYSQENALHIEIVPASPETTIDQLIEMVSKGTIDYTIADENVAKMLRNFYPNIHIETPLSLTQRIAWAVRKGNDSLSNMLDRWVNTNRGKTKYNVIYNKYFKYRRLAMQTDNYFHTVEQGDISDIDRLIKEYSSDINWDWRLVAALINKESKFNPYAESPYGARGLMQLMPATAARFGVNPDEIYNPQKNIMAGTRFLEWLDIRLEGILDDTTDIQKFVLASYNVGLGHVLDARRLAKKFGKDPDNWEEVSDFLLKKSSPKYYTDPVVKYGYCRGKEPVNYVKKILEYYNLYSMYAAA